MTSPGMSSSSASETRGASWISNPTPCLVQDIGDLAVDVPAVDARPDHGEGRLLALQDGVVHLLQPLVRFAPDEGAGHVGVVAGREVNGEDVDDDGLSCLQGAMAALVRVGRLRTS